MSWLASWPATNHIDAGCEAFDSEGMALLFARGMTAKGVARVVVYEINDEHIERAS